MSLLGKANDSVELVKSALDAKVALATAEEKEKLADAKIALANLKEMIADLKEENYILADKLKEREDFELEMGVYWRVLDKEKNQPFCPVCYSNGKQIPLQKLWDGRDKTQTKWNCPTESCKDAYNPWNYKEPSHVGVSSGGGFFHPDMEY